MKLRIRNYELRKKGITNYEKKKLRPSADGRNYELRSSVDVWTPKNNQLK